MEMKNPSHPGRFLADELVEALGLTVRELAGVLGALAAIPVAGSLQVILVDWLRRRRGEEPAAAT